MEVARRKGREDGFTLMELLISIAIFAVVISSVYGAYRVTFQTIDGADKQAFADSTGRIALGRISEDLATLVTDNEGLLIGEHEKRDSHHADSFSCIAYAHLDFSREGRSGSRAYIRYTLVENEADLLDLYRYDEIVRPSERQPDLPRGELLARDLLSFKLTYVEEGGREVDEWNSDPEGEPEDGEEEEIELPVLVRVEMILASSPDDEVGISLKTSIALPVDVSDDEADES